MRDAQIRKGDTKVFDAMKMANCYEYEYKEGIC